MHIVVPWSGNVLAFPCVPQWHFSILPPAHQTDQQKSAPWQSFHSGHSAVGIMPFLQTSDSPHMVCGYVSCHPPAAFFLLILFRSRASAHCNPPLHFRYSAWQIQFLNAGSGTIPPLRFHCQVLQSNLEPDYWYNRWSHHLLPSFSFQEGSCSTVSYYPQASGCVHPVPHTAAVFHPNHWT